MDGLLYVFAMIAVGMVIDWAMKNDGGSVYDRTSGIFAMRQGRLGGDAQGRRGKYQARHGDGGGHLSDPVE